MLDHVTIRVSDLDASRRFDTTVLATSSHDEWEDFSVAPASEMEPATRHLHVALAERTRDEVDAFWRGGVDAGYRSDGARACVRGTPRTTTARSRPTPTATASRR